jgi:hypothetical protein
MYRLKHIVVYYLFIFLLIGCSSTTKFIYTNPEISTSKSAGFILVCKEINDKRDKKDIDEVYKDNPLIDIKKILADEVLSTGLFKTVGFISDDQARNISYLKRERIDFLVDVTLTRLEWEVSDYNQILGTTFIVSILTGGLGGLIYGATPTDVYGNAIFKIKMVDTNSGKPYFEKEYIGKAKESMAKLSSDTTETKATMIGKAVKLCMEEFKADLVKVTDNKKRNGKSIETKD